MSDNAQIEQPKNLGFEKVHEKLFEQQRLDNADKERLKQKYAKAFGSETGFSVKNQEAYGEYLVGCLKFGVFYSPARQGFVTISRQNIEILANITMQLRKMKVVVPRNEIHISLRSLTNFGKSTKIQAEAARRKLLEARMKKKAGPRFPDLAGSLGIRIPKPK